MKLKHASWLAVIGILLNVFPYLSGLLGEFDNKILAEYSLMIAGNILMVIFFFIILTRPNSKAELIKSGVFGLSGYLVMIVLNLLGMIINASYILASKALGIQLSVLGIILVNSSAGTLLKIIPILFILIGFIFLYKGLNKDYRMALRD